MSSKGGTIYTSRTKLHRHQLCRAFTEFTHLATCGFLLGFVLQAERGYRVRACMHATSVGGGGIVESNRYSFWEDISCQFREWLTLVVEFILENQLGLSST